MQELVVATRNKGKLKEIKQMLHKRGLEIEVRGLEEFPSIGEVPEPGETFEENAIFKARFVAQRLGRIVLSDDSGLEVDALNGRPGVYSARFSGEGATDERNNAKLLEMLRSVPPHKRGAQFRCVMVLYSPEGDYVLTQGIWRGRIATEPSGDGGFGYDPIFIDEEKGMTAASMDMETKNRRSHRGRALLKISTLMENFFAMVQKG